MSDQALIMQQDLFSANVFRDPEQAAVFYSFISSLYSSSTGVQPTKTHKFIARLASKKKLVRCYTQNIDCLEEKAGLASVLDKRAASPSKGKGKQTYEGEVVQLHGRIDRLKCGCGYEGDWTSDVLDQSAVGEAASCPECDQRGMSSVAIKHLLTVKQPPTEQGVRREQSAKSDTLEHSNLLFYSMTIHHRQVQPRRFWRLSNTTWIGKLISFLSWAPV